MIPLRAVMGYGPSSGLIAWRTNGLFSHIDARVPPGGIANIPWAPGSLVGSRSDKIGGQPPGLRCRPYGYERVLRAMHFYLPATEEQEIIFWNHLYSEDGYAYDKPGILSYVFNSNMHAPGEFYCSAVILDGLEASDWMKPTYQPYWKIAPGPLTDTVTTHGAIAEIDSGGLWTGRPTCSPLSP
jgi:hypothetical protein